LNDPKRVCSAAKRRERTPAADEFGQSAIEARPNTLGKTLRLDAGIALVVNSKLDEAIKWKPAMRDRRPIHHSPIFWIGIVLCLAAITIYLWSNDLSWSPGTQR
jgi:hypothetical protein